MDFDDFLNFYRAKIEPFFAVAILIFLIVSSSMLYKEMKQREQIQEKCGWEDETTRCWCEKSTVLRLENLEINNWSEDVLLGEYP